METIKAALQQGAEWARNLKVGDSFLGTMGEARARGLTGIAAKAFHCAAYANLPDGIACGRGSNVIVTIGPTAKGEA